MHNRDVSSGEPKSFVPVLTIPGENRTCAVDNPSNVMSLAGVGDFPDMTQCAMQCTTDAVGCSGFNVKIDMRLCEMYSYIPTRFALVPGCEYRQVNITDCRGNKMGALGSCCSLSQK